MVFVIMDDATEKTRAFADDKSRRKVLAMFTSAGLGGDFAMWANGFMIR